jgi:hypothetical protein
MASWGPATDLPGATHTPHKNKNEKLVLFVVEGAASKVLLAAVLFDCELVEEPAS